MNHSIEYRENWGNCYNNYTERWHDKYNSHTMRYSENEKPIWNGICIFCVNITEKGVGFRNCDNCYTVYYKTRKKYICKARNLCAFKTNRKCEITGITRDDFRKYIQDKFTMDMRWDNYGKVWQIDHIIPSAWFDFTDMDEILVCCHYTNLQPLSCIDNYNKCANILPRAQEP